MILYNKWEEVNIMKDEFLQFAQKKEGEETLPTTTTLIVEGIPSQVAYNLLINSLGSGKPISREEITHKTNNLLYGKNITFSYSEVENLFSPDAMTEQDHITIEPSQNQGQIPEERILPEKPEILEITFPEKPEILEIPFPEDSSEREDYDQNPGETNPVEPSWLHDCHEIAGTSPGEYVENCPFEDCPSRHIR